VWGKKLLVNATDPTWLQDNVPFFNYAESIVLTEADATNFLNVVEHVVVAVESVLPGILLVPSTGIAALTVPPLLPLVAVIMVLRLPQYLPGLGAGPLLWPYLVLRLFADAFKEALKIASAAIAAFRPLLGVFLSANANVINEILENDNKFVGATKGLRKATELFGESIVAPGQKLAGLAVDLKQALAESVAKSIQFLSNVFF